MALPKVNEVLNFTMTVPSTGKTVKYRPYLVKEEKVLLQAFESKDVQACLRAISDTIDSCLDPREDIKVAKLATFDIEYMFTQIRSKSVGETSTILIACKDCDERNEYTIDLEELKIEVNPQGNIVEVTDDIKVEMRYPTYEKLIDGKITEATEGDLQSALSILSASIVAVHTGSERIDADKHTIDEMNDFLGSMTAQQLKKISEYLEEMPKLEHNAAFACQKCEAVNELTLSGLSDFF